jgi:hypothetical protein
MNEPPDKLVTATLVGHVIDAIFVMRYQLDFMCENQQFGFSVSSPFSFGRDAQVDEMPWTDFPLSQTDLPTFEA